MRASLALTGTTALAAAVTTAARRVSRFRPTAGAAEPVDLAGLDADAAAGRLAELIRIPTVSYRDRAEVDEEAFARFRARLAELYPRTHAALEREQLGDGALLYRWRGTTDEPPLVLMAHYDVVPVEGQDWTRDPFAGLIEDGVVHGRGAIDDKGYLVAILEAVEALVTEGFTPRRDVWLSFGNDEEVTGVGAQLAVAAFTERGIRPWAVLDEGGAVVTGMFPGVPGQVAVVGLAEKGRLDVELVTTDPGGHASSPTPGGAPARLAKAITALDEHPFPARMNDVVLGMVDAAGRYASGPLRAVFAHAGSLGPVLARVLAGAGREANALVRTTVAVTRLEGSKAGNVLATTAKAHLNIRIALGETVGTTVERLRRVIGDPTVELRVLPGGADPSPVSVVGNDAYEAVAAAARAAYPDAVVAPYLMVQASDSRHFAEICDSVYRFMPFAVTREELAALHAADERISIAALHRGAGFVRHLLRSI
ncbi:M20/M25/M40 family metallo-hydrolase [Blastococcus sp. TML/M2B]|uniref:M20/M25/M40 family metallo-hydrolase n=1 Tax=unclassified Blastococcus TaxID=2619396 RepID=UPI00190D4AFF|nr:MULTISPECIES: M20/M25/M40 family metallo-hydrolase [unclassified Blastococcus]MBN1091152.1 M20/M25/M40 family metallo-hydrolase [Blastococcus sp. TML/M2B]MBN1095295.1 M20/M25/M40 family metallo-hydrolase [Blastococcus sp. TML/C7B]